MQFKSITLDLSTRYLESTILQNRQHDCKIQTYEFYRLCIRGNPSVEGKYQFFVILTNN